MAPLAARGPLPGLGAPLNPTVIDRAVVGAALDLSGRLIFEGRLGEAEAELRKSLVLFPGDPELEWHLGICLLSQGRYRQGLRLYEARIRHPDKELTLHPMLPYPEWRGEPLRGKHIALISEQGLGDHIMTARFAPWMAAQGAEVTIMSSAALVSLFGSLGVNVVDGRRSPPCRRDYWVRGLSIMRKARLDLGSVPKAPYLSAEGSISPSGAQVGVLTRGNPRHPRDAQRSLSASDAASLLALPGALDLHIDSTGAKDFAETAAIIAGLDLVISVDSAVAHLAGAMGKPVWILIPAHGTDWRWMRDRTDSPWYPSAKLYRQQTPGDWVSVIERVKRDAGAFFSEMEIAASAALKS